MIDPMRTAERIKLGVVDSRVSHWMLRQAFTKIPLLLLVPIGVPGGEARGSLCCSSEGIRIWISRYCAYSRWRSFPDNFA